MVDAKKLKNWRDVDEVGVDPADDARGSKYHLVNRDAYMGER